MDDTGLPQITDELPELSALPTQDIPTAVRENASTANLVKPVPNRKHNPLVWGLGILALASILPLGLLLRSRLTTLPQIPLASNSSPSSPTTASPASPQVEDSPTVMLGHERYLEAPTSELVPLSSDSSILMRKAAAKKVEEMIEAAATDGVSLHVISGFRSIADQNKLFFDVKAERGEDPTKRAAVSAPPGYSEHHTGYAVDLGDGDNPSTDLQSGFEQTKAFKWLKDNAAHYSFEMSFAKGNPMGVSYEPWHWRFVGDSQSRETFYRARSGSPTQSAPQSAASASPNAEAEAAEATDSRSGTEPATP